MHCPYFLPVMREHVVTVHRVTTATYELAHNNPNNANGKLVNKHRHTFVKEIKSECLQLIGAAGLLIMRTILAAYKSHISQRFNRELKNMVDIALDVKKMTEWRYETLTKEDGHTKKEIQQRVSKEIRILAGKMKWALLSVKTSKAGRQLDTKQISDTVLRDRMACLIKRVFGTYPEDYSFGDKGL
ncbi:hypothetical protein LPJ66_000379 [Kickxella alabastrina]|uniref:Uncharacterized protein n=1 Tax=Kickxella alabastrina TaxID=61397 RepID=A0ACC1IW99_9FUNG|nr:hypothetical protein LPJ66_000379 [Kickxella alabastrina]